MYRSPPTAAAKKKGPSRKRGLGEALLGLDKESIRLAIRRGQLETIFDIRLLQYFVPHSAPCSFLRSSRRTSAWICGCTNVRGTATGARYDH